MNVTSYRVFFYLLLPPAALLDDLILIGKGKIIALYRQFAEVSLCALRLDRARLLVILAGITGVQGLAKKRKFGH